MTKTKTKSNFFLIIVALIIVFFTLIIFLSIPVLFNYKSIERQIEKKFYSTFNINLRILEEVNYQFVPQPHLLIKKANLNLEKTNSSIIETENLKVFLSPKSLYSKSNIKFTKLEIQNTNFKFKLDDLNNFRNHLYNKENNQIIIKKSKLFILDKENKTILISPINNIFYLLNAKDNFKKLKIKGNIFDIDYESTWKKNYGTSNKSQTEIKLKNPNITIKNLFEVEKKSKFKGESSINFLNEIITLKYFLDHDKIKIISPNLNERIKISSYIELNPFYFETDLIFTDYKLNFLIDEFLPILINYNPEILGNLNGSLKIRLENINNEFINNGVINFLINEKTINLEKIFFKIDGGTINSKILYIEDKGDLVFVTNNLLEIENKKEFAKKFQIKLDSINKINKINFTLKKNIETREISISQIKINNLKNKNLFNKIYKVGNINELKSLLKSILNA